MKGLLIILFTASSLLAGCVVSGDYTKSDETAAYYRPAVMLDDSIAGVTLDEAQRAALAARLQKIEFPHSTRGVLAGHRLP